MCLFVVVVFGFYINYLVHQIFLNVMFLIQPNHVYWVCLFLSLLFLHFFFARLFYYFILKPLIKKYKILRFIWLNMFHLTLMFISYDASFVDELKMLILRKNLMFINLDFTISSNTLKSEIVVIKEERWNELIFKFTFLGDPDCSFYNKNLKYRRSIPKKSETVRFLFELILAVLVFLFLLFFLIPNGFLLKFCLKKIHIFFFDFIYDLDYNNNALYNKRPIILFFLFTSYAKLFHFIYFIIQVTYFYLYNIILNWYTVHQKNLFICILHENAYLRQLVNIKVGLDIRLLLFMYDEINCGLGFNSIDYYTESIGLREFATKTNIHTFANGDRLANELYGPYYDEYNNIKNKK